MHRTIGYLSTRFVQIRPGERRKVLLTFLYFFLVITSYYLVKPVSRSLVLGHLGSRMVPYLDLVCVALMGPAVALFARCADRLPAPTLVSRACGVLIGIMTLFWWLLRTRLAWIAGMFYAWVAIFSVLSVALFWLVANHLYRPREIKRLFGFIGAGGILGGIVGSSLAAIGAQLIGTEPLVLVSAGVLVAGWFVVQRLWACAPARAAARPEEEAPAARRQETLVAGLGGIVTLLRQSRYLMWLVAMVGLNKLVATLMYYQLNPFIERAFADENARTTFIGLFLGGVNVLSFVTQFFLTSWVLRRWGLFAALLALPIGLMGGCVGMLAAPLFWLAAGLELFDGSMNYSLQQTTKEALYLPIDRSIRDRVKPFIDTVVFRIGKGGAALLAIVLLQVWHAPPVMLSIAAIPLLIAWVVVALRLRKDRLATLRIVLHARAVSAQGAAEEASSRKLALVNRLFGTDHAPPIRALAEELARYEAHPAAPAGPELQAPRLRALVSDQHAPMAARRQAIRRLARDATQATVDYLLGLVMVEEDAVLRQGAVRGLVKVRLGNGRLEFPALPIRRQVEREVANHRRIVNVASIYRHHRRGPAADDDPVLALLRALLAEYLEQLFQLLMLLYHPEDIHLIYEQLRAPDAHLRADAIELLDTLVDPAMRVLLFPVLDEDRVLSLGDEGEAAVPEPAAAYRLLQEAIWDHSCWLSVTALCVAGRLRLTTLKQELEKASRHHVPLISMAGRAALHLAELP